MDDYWWELTLQACKNATNRLEKFKIDIYNLRYRNSKFLKKLAKKEDKITNEETMSDLIKAKNGFEAFFYLLLRDYMPLSKVMEIVDNVGEQFYFPNVGLSNEAISITAILNGKDK